MSPREWHRTGSRLEGDHRVFRVRTDAAVSPRTGVEHEFCVLESADQVAVVAITEDERLVLVRQFRHGLREVTVELPGGLVDEGQTPEEAARAELRQETGHGGGVWTALGRLSPLPAVFTNHLHVFLARGVRLEGEPRLDPGEDIVTELVPLTEARRLVAEGELVHAQVVAALFLWEIAERAREGTAEPAPHPPDPAAPAPAATSSVRDRVEEYLRAHHTATIATVGFDGAAGADGAPGADGASGVDGAAGAEGAPGAGSPHAATVFYAVDSRGRLVFLSSKNSRHGRHIGRRAAAAVTVAAEYDDWRQIRGVQAWGEVELLGAAARVAALTAYLTRFPFARTLLEDPALALRLRDVGVYRFTPRRASFTDNVRGPFARETVDL